MSDDKKSYISKDMREHLYDIVGKRIDKAFEFHTAQNYANCFREISAIKFLLASEMSDDNLNFFNNFQKIINDNIKFAEIAYTGNKAEQIKYGKYIDLLPERVTMYLELIFKEMSGQGIWFPKAFRYDNFNAMLMAQNFGLDSKEDIEEGKQERINVLNEVSKEDLIKMLKPKHLNELYNIHILNNVLKK